MKTSDKVVCIRNTSIDNYWKQNLTINKSYEVLYQICDRYGRTFYTIIDDHKLRFIFESDYFITEAEYKQKERENKLNKLLDNDI